VNTIYYAKNSRKVQKIEISEVGPFFSIRDADFLARDGEAPFFPGNND